MKEIAVDQLKPGQRFSRPIYIDADSLFVPEGVAIKERDIERLRKWEITVLQSEGEPISDDPQAAFNAFFLRAFNSPVQRGITRTYGALKDRLMECFGKVRNKESVEQDVVNRVVDELVKLIEASPNDVVQYMLYGMQGETGEVENALNTAVFSAMVGHKMQISRHHLLTLVTAAVLHDIGMVRVPQEILAKKSTLSEDERRQVQTHPVHSYKIITKDLSYGEEVGRAALQHQERWDGAGYLRRLKGDAICQEARIISVADSFVAMVSHKPYRTSMIGYTAMRNLLSDNGTRFDPAVLKVFIQVLGIYPIGSIVLLSDSSVCRVLENRSNVPLKPIVKTIIDRDGHEYVDDNGAVIDLAEDKSVFIARAVDANSLADKHRKR